MTFNEIEPGSEADVRAFLQERPTISGEECGMLAQLFESMEQGLTVVHRLVDELGVRVEGAPSL